MNLPIAIFLLSILLGSIEISTQIAGGVEVPPGVFASQVMIFHLGIAYCNGGIIDTMHIMTPAHCVRDLRVAAYAIVAGRADLSDFIPQWRGVKRITPHPNFHTNFIDSEIIGEVGFTYTHDIAVLTLHHSFLWSDTVLPMQLSAIPLEDIYSHQRCMIAGWGKAGQPTPTGTSLKSITVRIWSRQESVQRDHTLKTNEFHAEAYPKISDSYPINCGAPLVCDDIFVGILIFASDSENYTDTYAPFAPYMDFIKRSLND